MASAAGRQVAGWAAVLVALVEPGPAWRKEEQEQEWMPVPVQERVRPELE